LTDKAAAYSNEAPSGAPLLGRLHILPTNIGIGWKGLSQGNIGTSGAFVHYGRKKSFITFDPGLNNVKLF
jgi:hypothetical protein